MRVGNRRNSRPVKIRLFMMKKNIKLQNMGIRDQIRVVEKEKEIAQ